jgi:hypothetical protein
VVLARLCAECVAGGMTKEVLAEMVGGMSARCSPSGAQNRLRRGYDQ